MNKKQLHAYYIFLHNHLNSEVRKKFSDLSSFNDMVTDALEVKRERAERVASKFITEIADNEDNLDLGRFHIHHHYTKYNEHFTKASVIALYSAFEALLSQTCHFIIDLHEDQQKYKKLPSRLKNIVRYKKYLSQYRGFSFDEDQWRILEKFTILRNILVHADGSLLDRFKKQGDKLAGYSENITVNRFWIDVKPEYLNEITPTTQAALRHIQSEIYRIAETFQSGDERA